MTRLTTPSWPRRAVAPGAQPGTRRGAVGIAVIALLVIIQLIIVATVVAGARDQDMTVQRLDAVRAFYACESGSNMAVREWYRSLDEDGDGTIGTISNDGNAANDPALGPARWSSVLAGVPGGTSATCTGRSALCRTKATVVMQGGANLAAAGNASTIVGIARNGQTTPRYALWNGGAWGANTALPWSAPGKVLSLAVRACPTRNEIFFGCIDDTNALSVCVFNGASWGAVMPIAPNIARDKDRPFDVCYESQSGRAMTVFWDDAASEFAYRVWDGATLSAKVMMSGSGTDHSHFVSLWPRYGTNEIMALCNDHQNPIRLLAKVWNGSSWSAWTVISNNLAKVDRECFAGAYQTMSGTGMVVYGELNQVQPRYRTWNGSSWSAASTLPTIGKNPFWVRLAPDPGSNTVLCAMGDQDKDVELNVWNGSAWGSNLQATADQGADHPRMYDVAFEPGTGKGVLFYRNNAKNYPVYRTWNGAAWSAEQNGPNINRHLLHVQTTPGFSSGEVWLICCDDQADLHMMKWNGTSLGADSILETTLSDGEEPANVVAAPITWKTAKILSWTEVAPQ
jgi:hypothetical protein